jgi:tripartite-type tricarboxylate transporter receptor subunit TctC
MPLARLLFAALIVFASSTHANSQLLGSDQKTKIIAPFAAGGAVDQIARIVANNMPEGGAIVDNRTGAGGDIGVTAAARATPDGHTLLLHTSSYVINATIRGKSKEIAEAFEPLARIGAVKFVLVVRSDLPAKSLSELIALAKSGKNLSYGSTGHGTTLHIAGEMLNDAAGIKAVHVPYRGLNPAFTDILGGQIDYIITSVIGVLPYVRTGKVRALAVFESERAEQLPDIPTMGELGFPELVLSNWYGIFTQAAVPESRRNEIEDTLMQVLRSPKVSEQLLAAGVTGPQNAAAFKKSVSVDFARWPALLNRISIKFD